VDLSRHKLFAYSAFAFDEHGEIGSGNAFDAGLEASHGRRTSDERRWTIAPRSLCYDIGPRPRQLHSESFDFDYQNRQLGAEAECLYVPCARHGARPQPGLEAVGGLPAREFEERGRSFRWRNTRRRSACLLANLQQLNRYNAAQRFFERAARSRQIAAFHYCLRHGGHNGFPASPAIALSALYGWPECGRGDTRNHVDAPWLPRPNQTECHQAYSSSRASGVAS
jgi:hypothetical protein